MLQGLLVDALPPPVRELGAGRFRVGVLHLGGVKGVRGNSAAQWIQEVLHSKVEVVRVNGRGIVITGV